TQSNINKVSGSVTGVQHGVQESKADTEEISKLLGHIQQNTNEVMNHAELAYTLNVDMAKASAIVLHEITSVAQITEQSSASVQQVLASSEMQQKYMENAVNNVAELNQLTEKLTQLIAKNEKI